MIRKGRIEDLDACYQIILDAKEFMKQTGSLQWQQGYPYKETIEKDLINGCLYLVEEDDIIKGMIVLKQEFTKNYVNIDGKWDYPVSDDDLVIHRLAVKKEFRGTGIAKKLMNYALSYAKEHHITHLKTDTHPKNISMQKTAESVGFKRKGIVVSMLEKLDYYRIAYELLLD